MMIVILTAVACTILIVIVKGIDRDE